MSRRLAGRADVHHGLLAVCLVALTAGPAGQEAGSTATASRIVATAGDVSVSSDELTDAAIEARRSADPKRMLETLTPEGLERMALALLERKVLAAAGRAAGVDRQAAVQRALADAADTVLARAFVDQQVAAIDTSEAGLRRYFETHETEFRVGPRRKAHHIVVRTREEAEAALAEIKAGRRLEEMAAARNTDDTKAVSGDLGWVSRGVMVRAFDDALFGLARPGQTTGVVATSFGFHIVRLDEVDPGRLPPFDTVRDQVRQALVSGVRARLKADLAKRYPVSVNRDVLAQFGR